MTNQPATDFDATATWIVHERFFELYDQMLGEMGIEEVLERLSQIVNAEMDAEGTTVYLLREETGELEARVVVRHVPRLIRIPIDDHSLAGYCAHSQRSFVIADAYGDLSAIAPGLRFDRSWDEAHQFRTRDVICAPALFKGTIVGVVQVINSRTRRFNDHDRPALLSVARLVGYVLYHARLYDDLASLKELQREKAKFMRVMVHELKSPVSAAKMTLQMLQNGLVKPDRQGEFLDRIGDRLDGLVELITDTLELSKLSSGEPLGDIQVVDLAALLPVVCQTHRDLAQAKGLAFTIAPGEAPLPVRIDQRALQIAVSNLVSNAVKYTAEGAVTVAASRQSSEAIVSVQDTGMGIPEAELPRLFEEFYRASNARQSAIHGSGVGLAGAKRLIERFGGTLELSTSEGAGSTFTMRLALVPGDGD